MRELTKYEMEEINGGFPETPPPQPPEQNLEWIIQMLRDILNQDQRNSRRFQPVPRDRLNTSNR